MPPADQAVCVVTRQFPGQRTDAIWRILEANRAKYDSATPSAGQAEKRVQELETDLAATRRHLYAIERSSFWRLTSPLRWMAQAVKALQPTRAQPDQTSAPGPAPDRIPTYQDWIDGAESAAIAALLRPGAGHLPVTAPRLGVVLWTDDIRGGRVAEDLAAALTQLPPSCDVLVLCPKPALTAVAGAGAAAARPNITIEAGGSFAAALPAALQRMEAAYLCFHHLTDQIAPQALDLVTCALAEQPQIDLLFGDEDWIDMQGQRSQPFFKPGWDPELQRGQDLVGPFAFYRATRLRQLDQTSVAGPAWRYDVACRIAAASRPERIRHVPAVLCHRMAPMPAGYAAAMGRHAEMHLQAQGIAARVEPMEGPGAWQRVVYTLPEPKPFVSVIVPTRDRPELLRICADGVLNQTDYRHIELLIVDNGTEDAEALALLTALSSDPRVRVLRRPGPFNWSTLNNDAALAAKGEILVLLNNDIAVLRSDWMDALVAHALQPGVGAAGAKLLYQDGRVQHAGIATDRRGAPRHLFRFAAAEDAGPSGLLILAHSVWAVTGACLAVRRDVFFEVGGLNEGLPVAYNDIDLCMRLTAQGYRIVWTPAALLEHRELASRPPDHVGPRREQSQEERNRLARDWGTLIERDPFLNPNFNLTDERLQFRLSPL